MGRNGRPAVLIQLHLPRPGDRPGRRSGGHDIRSGREFAVAVRSRGQHRGALRAAVHIGQQLCRLGGLDLRTIRRERLVSASQLPLAGRFLRLCADRPRRPQSRALPDRRTRHARCAPDVVLRHVRRSTGARVGVGNEHPRRRDAAAHHRPGRDHPARETTTRDADVPAGYTHSVFSWRAEPMYGVDLVFEF